MVSNNGYQYKYNGKELQDELGLNMYDYGARNYDPALGRWMNIDPLAEKFSNISTYNYTANNPVLYVDPDGKDIYLFYATKGNSEEDDAMFWQAALTKARDFLSSDSFSGNDILRIAKVDDLASIESDAESFIAKNSEKYGKTKEFGVWSHAGTDGPVGTVETSKNKLSALENKQMSLDGWGSINFNWAKNAKAYFYGCNTGVDPSGDKQAFNTEISQLGNFKNVSVYGQTTYSYPSMYSNSRRPSSNQLNGVFGKEGEPTYLVGGNRYTQPWIGWFGDTHFEAHKMSVSKNGKALTTEYQKGKTTN
jgi:RHS repeat-associated protein